MKIRANKYKKAVKASATGKIPYDLVSMLVILRDWASVEDGDYINDEHKKLVDIADTLYNVGISVDEMKPEFQKVYKKYGEEFFDKVLDDVSALDTQVTSSNVNDLIADYNDREAAFTGVNASCGKKVVKASTDKDYSDLTGMKFNKARDILTKDGFSEHEYGDTKEGNGYAVYRKGNKEVELTYEWVGPMNRAHAGNVIDVYVDEDINTWAYADEAKKYANKSTNASVRSNRRAVKASYTYKYAVWVLDGDDNTWKCWGGKDSTDLGMSEDEFLDSINHQTYPNPEYNVDNNYVDVMVIDGDKTPADYGQTENVKEYGEIAESTRRAVKASNVMAASDVSNLKIYVPSMCYVDVMVDNYEQGEGEQVNSWDFSVSSEPYNSAQELIDDIARHSGIFSNNIADYVVLDGSLQTDAEVTVDNEIPTDADYEAWKRGELELFVAHLWVNLQVGAETHDITDDEAEGFGLSVY